MAEDVLDYDRENAVYREGRTRMFQSVLEMLAVIAPVYDSHGRPLEGVREAIEVVAESLDGPPVTALADGPAT